jgi:hypothetical protein
LKIPIRWHQYKQNVAIFGANQEGKTTLAFEIAQDLVKHGIDVIIYDEHGNFTKLNPMCVKHNLLDLTGKGLEIFQPNIISDEVFEDFCWKVFTEFQYVVVFIDEIHNHVTKHDISKKVKTFVQNCNQDTRMIGYVCTFHSPSEVNNAILRTSQIKFVFNMDLVGDVEYVAKWIDPMAWGFLDGTIAQYQGICKKRHEQAVLFSL